MDKQKIAKTLFLITCSGPKCSEREENYRWEDILNCAGVHRFSKFPEFTDLRRNLSDYLTQLSDEKAGINKSLYSSKTCKAIYRYNGHLYKKLRSKVKEALAEGSISNVLIISALHGPTHPSDYLPNYDLTMDNKYKTQKLRELWPKWIKSSSGKNLPEFLCGFESLTLMVGDAYKRSALAIKEIMPNCCDVHVEPHCWSASTTKWGEKLDSLLS